MDPRPYHYQYRRPRLSNPTFQSLNLYQSLYHRDVLNRYQPPQSPLYQQKYSYQPPVESPKPRSNHVNQYIENYANKFIQKKQRINNKISNQPLNQHIADFYNPQSSRPYSNRSNKSQDPKQKQQRHSILASYGRNSMIEPKQRPLLQQKQRSFTQQTKLNNKNSLNQGLYDRINQFTVYKKQQKPYNIIGNYPRSTSTELKKYPKLSLQNKLIQQGKYLPY